MSAPRDWKVYQAADPVPESVPNDEAPVWIIISTEMRAGVLTQKIDGKFTSQAERDAALLQREMGR